MNTTIQLEQTATPICGGMQNVVIPRLQLPHKEEQIVSERLDTLRSSLCLHASPMWLLDSPTIQSKEPFQATNIAVGILLSGFVNISIVTAIHDKKFTLDHIDIDNEILTFTRPIIANISFNDNIYSCKSEDLGIISAAPNLEDCIKDFKDEVSFVYNEYGKEDDNRLTSDAKELKRRILSHVRE